APVMRWAGAASTQRVEGVAAAEGVRAGLALAGRTSAGTFAAAVERFLPAAGGVAVAAATGLAAGLLAGLCGEGACAVALLTAIVGASGAGAGALETPRWCSAMKSRTWGYTVSRQRRPLKMP